MSVTKGLIFALLLLFVANAQGSDVQKFLVFQGSSPIHDRGGSYMNSVKFSKVSTKTSNIYNSTTGTFTVPSSGVYIMHCYMCANTTARFMMWSRKIIRIRTLRGTAERDECGGVEAFDHRQKGDEVRFIASYRHIFKSYSTCKILLIPATPGSKGISVFRGSSPKISSLKQIQFYNITRNIVTSYNRYRYIFTAPLTGRYYVQCKMCSKTFFIFSISFPSLQLPSKRIYIYDNYQCGTLESSQDLGKGDTVKFNADVYHPILSKDSFCTVFFAPVAEHPISDLARRVREREEGQTTITPRRPDHNWPWRMSYYRQKDLIDHGEIRR